MKRTGTKASGDQCTSEDLIRFQVRFEMSVAQKAKLSLVHIMKGKPSFFAEVKFENGTSSSGVLDAVATRSTPMKRPSCASSMKAVMKRFRA